MSRKDYEAIAKVLAGVGTTELPGADQVLASVATGLADVFAADNSRFDRSRFLVAAGVQI